MSNEMFYIAVCSSGSSPHQSKCVESILELVNTSTERVQLILILNHAQKARNPENRFQVIFEPVRGYSSVRNRALMSVPSDANLIFVDDDEIVSLDWFKALIEMHESYPGDLIVGPVLSAELNNGRSFRSIRALESTNLENGLTLMQAGAGNMLIPKSLLNNDLVWFDMHFNDSGSEDTDLCFRLRKRGVQVRFAAKAVAYELEDAVRYDPVYIANRKLKDIVNYSVVIRRNESWSRILYRFAILAIRMVLFGAMSLFSSKGRMPLKTYALSLCALLTGRVRR